MTVRVFLTGSHGLVGQGVRKQLEARGIAVIGCDLRADTVAERYDLRDAGRVQKNVKPCDGVIHLGALSRVVWGERHPTLCRSINIDGSHAVLSAAAESARKPWLIVASSREIYGTPPTLPCTPDTPPNPENTYAKSKLAGERMALELQSRGCVAAVLRFSNVFGATNDYHDRVVPAFAKAAAQNGTLQVRGVDHVFDFTALSDVVAAVLKAVDALMSGVGDLPPVDIVSGRATSLRELAEMAIAHGADKATVAPPQTFYPSRFQGDPRPAQKYLGWQPQQVLEKMFGQLVDDFHRLEENDAHTKSHSWVSALL